MKKSITLVIMLTLAALTVHASFAAEVSFEEAKFDIFSVKFDRPVNWNLEVEPEYAKFTNPEDKKVKLIFFQYPEPFQGTLEDYYADYRNNLVVEYEAEVESAENYEIAGMGAYYIEGKGKNGEFGHIIFVKDGNLYALALLTPDNQFYVYENILNRAAETLSFYSPAY